MNTAITALSTAVTGEALWGEVALAVPFIATIVLFAFGYKIVRRVTKGASSGTAKF